MARLLEVAEQGGRTGRVIEILTIQALALQKQGAFDQALSSLERALRLAESEGYVRLFVDEGPVMRDLLVRAAGNAGVHTRAYANELLAAFGPADEPVRSDNGILVEPLSERELEVLGLIAAGLSNKEIADQLVIALGTVKAHTSSIYGKMGVRSRTKAVARAQDLGLL
jgi:LuxR family maltose regulon positive regulatory protein